jgi:hypothetical protein
MERNMMLTPDEYMAFRRLISSEKESEGSRLEPKVAKRRTRRNPKMKRALRKANAKARKKDGSLKKGWSQSRVMKEAHRIKKRLK